jgi:serine/threonine protein kinase
LSSTDSSDVFSAGAVLYGLITKEGIYEGLKGKVEDLSEKEFNKFIKQKLNNSPRKLRKFLGKCLKYDPYSRYHNGEEFKQSLDKVIENLDSWKSFKNSFKKYVLPISLPVAIIGLCTYGVETHEPQKLDMPSIQPRLNGMLYKPGAEKSDNIFFERRSTRPRKCILSVSGACTNE